MDAPSPDASHALKWMTVAPAPRARRGGKPRPMCQPLTPKQGSGLPCELLWEAQGLNAPPQGSQDLQAATRQRRLKLPVLPGVLPVCAGGLGSAMAVPGGGCKRRVTGTVSGNLNSSGSLFRIRGSWVNRLRVEPSRVPRQTPSQA